MKPILFFILLFGIGFYFWYNNAKRWVELLTTQNVEKYMGIVGKLQNAGIKYKTTSGGEEFNFRQNTIYSKTPPISYTIWIDKEQVHKAYKIIN
ncbi:MAG: hypothetical protein ACOYVD_10655 [Bacillota bacterium]